VKKTFNRDWENNILVKESPIHAKGIFTNSDIPKDELVIVVQGEVISGKECERREDEENNVYIFWNGRYYIDTVKTLKIKYINHDCDANCEVMERDKETLNLVSIKDIKAGDEITMDYGYDEIYEYCSCNTCSEKRVKE
jgi:SET domain-containing protein